MNGAKLFLGQIIKWSKRLVISRLNAGSFSQDISPLLAPNIQWDFEKAAIDVFEKIIPLIPGKKWKSN